MPILEIQPDNPLIDGRQSERVLTIQAGVCRHFNEHDFSMLPEFTLKSGRRADLIGLDRKGRIVIVEIKSSVEDFRSDTKWPEYRAFCDRFFFATHPGVPVDIFPESEGLLIADAYGAEIMRDAVDDRMPAATRKALTLRLARAASQRLERVVRYVETSSATLNELDVE